MTTTRHNEGASLFPDKPSLSREDIGRRFGGVEMKRTEDARLHFGMLAPLGWRRRDPRETANQPGVLVSLCDGDPARAEISVTADELRREVSPAEWVRNKLERAGHVMLAQRERYGNEGAVADFLTETQGPAGRVIARTNMVKEAALIFTITCQAHEDIYPGLADDFFVALASFQLLNAKGSPLSEPLGAFCYIYPEVFGFSYPASWRLVNEVTGDDACDVRLDNFDGDHCAGRVWVSARTQQRPQRMMNEFLTKMDHAGIRPAARPDIVAREAPGGFVKAWSMVSAATRGSDEAEIRALVVEAPAMTLLFALAGPARSMSADWWAINKRAFEIVQASLYTV